MVYYYKIEELLEQGRFVCLFEGEMRFYIKRAKGIQGVRKLVDHLYIFKAAEYLKVLLMMS